ncbi:ammonium transporter [Akkermansiaceae bacterium]|nr:ammonium transporter [Akkermansiaceae bacterium]MDA7863397.1 ammonium transporter [Akkermansiaceae bacterium]MDA7931495.1 ammonium transporter [Akkermansiaceae bacterium]MDB0057136.1 ammonium transporter [Akkermansiaceae bacterium]MDB4294830.1 ammonium transporter [Akkermansiaceae bacterium]
MNDASRRSEEWGSTPPHYMMTTNYKSVWALLLTFFLSAGSLMAQEEPALDSGNTAWMLTATVLVLLMTLPGLALFYGGLVRAKNFLSVLMHCYAIAALASVMWAIGLYSLAFDDVGRGWLGGFGKFFLEGVGVDSDAGGFPETVGVMFQMTFAIITPGLIVGAFVERMKFAAIMVFTALWLVLVYAPAVHWVWGGGFMMDWGTKDLAGGIVVHATAGVSALVLAKMIGPRKGFPKQLHPPHSPGLVMIGASLLWVGWFGFNAGSQLAANGAAGMTMLVTHLSAATAALVWCIVERLKTGKTGVVGIATGMVAGLATITPASGNVGPMGAIVIGASAGVICYFMCGIVKDRFKIDDSLDVFAVHGVGGILGTLMVAFLGAEGVLGGLGLGINPATEAPFTMMEQFVVQVKALAITIVWSAVATVIIVYITRALVGLRVTEEVENAGLDSAEHGETAYNLD